MASSPPRRVHEPFVAAALVFALTTGFGLAAILVAALGLGFPLGAWWVASVQAHGHAQLYGWVGLFIIGVGLYFIPRLRGTVLARAELYPIALFCFSLGIAIRSLDQPLLGVLADQHALSSAWAELGRLGLVASALLELAGAAFVAVMLLASFRRARPLGPNAPILPVRGWLMTALVSFSSSTILNLLLAIEALVNDGYLFPAAWDDVLTHLLLMGFVLPVAISLSVRNLPLFMRLAFPPRRELSPLLVAYLLGMVARLMGMAGGERSLGSDIAVRLAGLGALVEGGVLLAFIWMIDIPLRRKPPWTVSRVPTPPEVAATRRPTRGNYPDYGEYGRFELLVISAFVWLAVAGGVAIVDGGLALVMGAAPLNPDIERHALTVGFITLLIFGMAVRMLPGFSGKPRVASPRLVLATFWLGNFAALCRVVPLFSPNFPGANGLLGISGTVGWIAVACLAVNLWRTTE